MTLRRIASLAGALVVAAIAALASYSHMRGLALRYGQPELISDLLPISVDGMMVVATIALGDGRRNRWSAWAAFWTGVTASVLANVLAAQPSGIARCISAWPAIAFLLVVEVITRGGPSQARSDADEQAQQTPAQQRIPALTPKLGQVPPTLDQSPPTSSTRLRTTARTTVSKRQRRPLSETQQLAAKLRWEHPGITQAELARRLGISATRLRQVERTPTPPQHTDGVGQAEAA